MKHIRIIMLVMCMLMVALLVVACAGDNNTTTSKTTSNPTASTPKPITPCGPGKHVVDSWEITKEATCKLKGERTGICSVCEDEVIEKTNITDHQWGDPMQTDPTCVNIGEIYQVCSICDEKEQIEELSIVDHNFTIVDDVTGKYSHYSCSYCETNYVRTKETAKDLLYWATNEVDFLSLETWGSDFKIVPSSLKQYEASAGGNVVAAMQDGKTNSGIYIYDRNNSVIKYEEQIVIQLDVMYEAFPAGGKQSLITIEHSDEYVFLVSINSSGYVCFIDEECYENPIKDAQLELNKWHNIAVVLDLAGIYMDEDFGYRLPYDIYLDGEKLVLETEVKYEPYIADRGEAGWGSKTLAESEKVKLRICDYGRGTGAVSYDCSLDNIRIYSGSEVDSPVRGEIDFGTYKITVDYPTAIVWETDENE